MLSKFRSALIILLAVGTMGLVVALPAVHLVYAAPEDVALFQDVLSRYGQWLDHSQHGPVWRPSQANRTWRPYTNGRWVPTQEGYVFETEEPWGWATYHYGNWVSTNEHGWVWVPGRTWYPHTVNWRTNDENVGWAPVPPPEYTGSDTYYSEGYGSTPSLDTYGSTPSQGTYGYSRNNSLSSGWTFTRATDFLLGYGLPYSPMYSYAYSGVLVAPQYIPVIYERTVIVNNYVTPRCAPKACYNWGPPMPYLARVTHLRNFEHDHRYKNLRPGQLRNVMPPGNLVHRHPAWREILPNEGTPRERSIRSVANLRTASGGLNRPDAIPAPLSLRRQQTEGASRHDGLVPSTAPFASDSPTGSQQVPGKMAEPNSGRRTPGYIQESRPAEPAKAQDQKASGTASRLPHPAIAQPSVSASTSSGDVAKQQQPVGQLRRQDQPHRSSPRDVQQQASQENRGGRQQDQRLPQELPRALQNHRGRPQGGEMSELQEQARQQQQMQGEHQRRQAESQRHQQMQQQAERQRQQQFQQQQRQADMMQQQQQQAEMQRQAQLQQQRQVEMQRHQQAHQERSAEMARQQQQVVRQAPPPPPAQQAPAPQRQKKHGNHNQQ